jgi:oligosaccharide repeat unit polymerase
MVYFSIAGLAALLTINLASSRSLLFPPSLFAAIWLLNLTALAALGDLFFSVSDTACLVYLGGAVAFSVGGLLVLQSSRATASGFLDPTDDTGHRKWIRHSLDAALLVLIAGFPYYFQIARHIAGDTTVMLMLSAIRGAEVEGQAGADPFGLIGGNLAVLSLLCAPAIFYESTGTWPWRLRTLTAVVLVLAYGFLSGSKESVLIILVLFFVSWIKRGELRLGTLALSTSLVVTLFAAGALLVNFAGATFENSNAALRKLSNTVLAYWLGGVVAFGRIVDDPDSIRVTQNIWRFFLEASHKLGADVVVPAIHAPYTIISSDPSVRLLGINVYTIYFSYYPDFGWAGVVIGMASIGAITTAVWERAMRGSPVHSLIFASLCVGIVLSFLADFFLLNLNFYIKATFFYATLYVLIPKIVQTLKGIYSKNDLRDSIVK